MKPTQYDQAPRAPQTSKERDAALIAAGGHAYGFLLGSRIGVIPASELADLIERNVDMNNPRPRAIVEAIRRNSSAAYTRTRLNGVIQEVRP